jgi:hypothetical protein
MQTRVALKRLAGKNTELFISDPAAVEKFRAVAERDAATIEERKSAQQTSRPHIDALWSRVEAAVDNSFDPTMPVVSTWDAWQATKKVSQHGSDSGTKALAFQLKAYWEADPTGVLTAGQLLGMKKHYSQNFGKSAAVGFIVNQLPKVGFIDLPIRNLSVIASKIRTQADYDEQCRLAGLAGNRPDQVRSRQYILALLKRSEESGDPMEVDVNQQQPDQLSGVDPGNAAELLKNGDPSIGQPRATEKVRASRLPTVAQVVEAALDAQIVKIAGWTMRVNDQDQVVLRSPQGGFRTARLSSIEGVAQDLLKQAQGTPNFDPKVNQQQPDQVRGIGNGDKVLGPDSDTEEGFTDPKPIQKHPAQNQPGTSTGVVGKTSNRTAAHRLAAQEQAPAWVGSPILWTECFHRIASFTGRTPSYLEVAARYKTACDYHECLYKVAGGAETLGKDSETEEGFAVPAVSPQNINKPKNQPGTSLPNAAGFPGPDTDTEPVPWENVKPNPKLSFRQSQMVEQAGGPGSGQKGHHTDQPGGGGKPEHPAMTQYKNNLQPGQRNHYEQGPLPEHEVKPGDDYGVDMSDFAPMEPDSEDESHPAYGENSGVQQYKDERERRRDILENRGSPTGPGTEVPNGGGQQAPSVPGGSPSNPFYAKPDVQNHPAMQQYNQSLAPGQRNHMTQGDLPLEHVKPDATDPSQPDMSDYKPIEPASMDEEDMNHPGYGANSTDDQWKGERDRRMDAPSMQGGGQAQLAPGQSPLPPGRQGRRQAADQPQVGEPVTAGALDVDGIPIGTRGVVSSLNGFSGQPGFAVKFDKIGLYYFKPEFWTNGLLRHGRKVSDKHQDIENLENQAINQLQTTQNLEKEVNADIVDSFVASLDPAEGYRQAKANRPSKALLEGIGDENGWLMRQAQSLIEGPVEAERDDIDQEGEPEVRDDGKMAFTFKYDASLTPPTRDELQTYVNGFTGGRQAYIVEANQAQDGYSFALIRQAEDEEMGPDDDEKREAVRWAVGKSAQEMQIPSGVPSSAPSLGGGDSNPHEGQEDNSADFCPKCGNPSLDPDPNDPSSDQMTCATCGWHGQVPGMSPEGQMGLDACMSCGASADNIIPTGNGNQCLNCGGMQEQAQEDPDQLPQIDPGQQPQGMGTDYAGTVLNHEGEAATAGGPGSGPQPQQAPAETEQHKRHNSPWSALKGGSKTAAALSEEWGDGGNYARHLEADDAQDVHQLHRYMNGEQPDWSHRTAPTNPAGMQPEAQAPVDPQPAAPVQQQPGAMSQEPELEPEPEVQQAQSPSGGQYLDRDLAASIGGM